MITPSSVAFVVLCFLNSFLLETEVKADESTQPEFFPLKGLQILTELNPTQTEDGWEIVEGDIVLPPGSRRKQDKHQETKGIINILTLWTNGKVSYNFHSSVDDDLKEMIVGAMKEWETHTCLKFNEKALDFNYIRFRADKEGCWSMIGRINSIFAGQDVSIGDRCNRFNVIYTPLEARRELFMSDVVILNRGQMASMTPQSILLSRNFQATPAGGHLTFDLQFR
ncbi:hypothetical protein AVEN_204445-1 [Araneus ventricosus]|uniref:Peptidase M12A domain-containing protein n=1 Tax=Araneus ventricosus TaxID=182803 RepID=A0A4Y2U139_ARAVE|nr:hypothetical protein AVEN_204445-1 [Araneus ventricosus]